MQEQYFVRQFELAEATGLPMFLHSRGTGGRMLELLRAHRGRFGEGVVHSFDGPADEAAELSGPELRLHVGLNGCSLRAEQNLAAARRVPAGRLMVETDCPWCEVKPTHAGYKYIAPVRAAATTTGGAGGGARQDRSRIARAALPA